MQFIYMYVTVRLKKECPCLGHDSISANEGEVQSLSLSVLHGGESCASRPGCFILGKKGLRSAESLFDPDALEKRQMYTHTHT
jgi:hypothetical protein